MTERLNAGAIADRNRYILESYLGLLARNPTGTEAAADATIGLADRLRGRSVQRALAQVSARSAGKDPALAAVARTEQDLGKQLNGAVADLANLLALLLGPARRQDGPGHRGEDRQAAHRSVRPPKARWHAGFRPTPI